jgi:hypothetical protein
VKTSDLEASLRSLDAATPPTFEQYGRAADGLDRIVATPAPPARRRPGRWVLIPVAVAALAVALVVLPWGRGGGRAYATWTPVPVALTPAETDLVGSACKKEIRGYMDLQQATLALAERRGEYVAMLYRTDKPDNSAFCLSHNLPGTDDVDDLSTAAGGGSGPAELAPPGTFTQGALADFGEASITDGAAGADVAALTVHAGEFTTQATVRGGRWVAWWPGPAIEWIGNGPETRDLMTYDLTLKDGTVIPAAQPWKGR